tara:strand:- start:24841 stop:25803 length:963 start_codon:yes stop_codon:yes gene_type:complete
MREVAFLKKNADKWQEFEALLNKRSGNSADTIADLYIEVSNDLAFAQSNYPESKTTAYLNDLAIKAHDTLYRNKRVAWGRIIHFWKQEIPLIFADHQKELLYAFLVFTLAIGIGVLSSEIEPDFIRSILGDGYVNRTIENIKDGDPLAVYKNERALNMFLGITVNNIRVSFIAFVFGLITSIGTGMVLFSNGIMVGTFFHMFYKYGIVTEAFLVVFIHGALELSVIVIAGAAGFVLGNSFLFPKTYSRYQAFTRAVRKGTKMVIGLVPIFILAGFLESFVTRYTEMPIWLSLFIILGSFSFILFYFVIYPQKLKKKLLPA